MKPEQDPLLDEGGGAGEAGAGDGGGGKAEPATNVTFTMQVGWVMGSLPEIKPACPQPLLTTVPCMFLASRNTFANFIPCR